MQNLFFLGIISVGKEKIQNKNNTKTKTIEVSHFAVETAGTGVREGTAGLAAGGPTDLPQGRSRAEPRQRGGWPGAQAAAGGQKGKRVQGFSAVENSEKNKNRNTCGLLKPYKLYQQNVLRSLKGFSDIFYFIVYSKVVFKTTHTEKRSLGTDWLCFHRNTNTTRYVLVGLL